MNNYLFLLSIIFSSETCWQPPRCYDIVDRQQHVIMPLQGACSCQNKWERANVTSSALMATGAASLNAKFHHHLSSTLQLSLTSHAVILSHCEKWLLVTSILPPHFGDPEQPMDRSRSLSLSVLPCLEAWQFIFNKHWAPALCSAFEGELDTILPLRTLYSNGKNRNIQRQNVSRIC